MEQRTITITNATPITSGIGDYGPWTLYGLAALDETGTPINETLKTFQELPFNQPIAVEIERRDSEKYGTEYTVKKAQNATYALRPSPADDSYEMLRAQLNELAQRVTALENGTPVYAQPARTDVPAPAPSPVAAPVDEEIPF